MSDRILLKLGGSILTRKGSPGIADMECMENIARVLSQHREIRLCIVHGAGSFGHPEAHRYGLVHGGSGSHIAEGIVRTHAAVCRLNAILIDTLNESGARAAGIHPLCSAMSREGRVVALEARPVRALMEAGVIPVLHGDVVMDETRGVSIASGDQVVRFLAEYFLARGMPFARIGLATDVPGVLGPDGRVIGEIGPENAGMVRAGGSRHTDVTGGMEGKLAELLALAKKGIVSEVFHVSRLSDFMNGKPHGGTTITGSITNG